MNKRIYTGWIIVLGSLTAFFLSMYFFRLFDSDIQFRNFSYMSKAIFSMFFVPLSFYGIGYSEGGHRSGIKYFLIVSAIFAAAFIRGYLTQK